MGSVAQASAPAAHPDANCVVSFTAPAAAVGRMLLTHEGTLAS